MAAFGEASNDSTDAARCTPEGETRRKSWCNYLSVTVLSAFLLVLGIYAEKAFPPLNHSSMITTALMVGLEAITLLLFAAVARSQCLRKPASYSSVMLHEKLAVRIISLT